MIFPLTAFNAPLGTKLRFLRVFTPRSVKTDRVFTMEADVDVKTVLRNEIAPTGINVWRDGGWTILYVRTGGTETTSSLTAKEAHDLAYKLLNSGSLLPMLTEICDRYAEDPDATEDQAAVASGICLDIEELLNGPVVPGLGETA